MIVIAGAARVSSATVRYCASFCVQSVGSSALPARCISHYARTKLRNGTSTAVPRPPRSILVRFFRSDKARSQDMCRGDALGTVRSRVVPTV